MRFRFALALAVAASGAVPVHAESAASSEAWLARFDSPVFTHAGGGAALQTYDPARGFIARFASPVKPSAPIALRADAGDPSRAFIDRLAGVRTPLRSPPVEPERPSLLAARR